MMTSSNGNIFHVTGHLCGEFTGLAEFPTQRPVTRSFNVFFDLRLNKRLSKQSWGWWFETLSRPLWRHRNAGLWINHEFRCQYLLHLLTLTQLNSLWPSDAIWRQRSGSKLVQAMACYLTAQSLNLNQCWLIISDVQWHSSEDNFITHT